MGKLTAGRKRLCSGACVKRQVNKSAYYRVKVWCTCCVNVLGVTNSTAAKAGYPARYREEERNEEIMHHA